jgi:hypothetical protein
MFFRQIVAIPIELSCCLKAISFHKSVGLPLYHVYLRELNILLLFLMLYLIHSDRCSFHFFQFIYLILRQLASQHFSDESVSFPYIWRWQRSIYKLVFFLLFLLFLFSIDQRLKIDRFFNLLAIKLVVHFVNLSLELLIVSFCWIIHEIV